MTGAWGFVEELSFVVFPLLLLALVAYFAITKRNPGGGFSLKGAVAILVLVLLPVVFGWKFTRELRNQLFFSHLRVEDVESFSIGTTQVTDISQKSLIVHALREIQWFSPHHDGWAQPVDFRIQLKSGEDRYFRIATYLREPGVTIDFASPRSRGGLHPGYGFSKSLTTALKEIGIELPR